MNKKLNKNKKINVNCEKQSLLFNSISFIIRSFVSMIMPLSFYFKLRVFLHFFYFGLSFQSQII